MSLDDLSINQELDGIYNEDYCKWCYTDGNFVYESLDSLLDFPELHMSNEHWPPDQVRSYFQTQLPKLKHWNPSAES